MPKEIISLEIGKCGHEIGTAFTNNIIQEWAVYNPLEIPTESERKSNESANPFLSDFKKILFSSSSSEIHQRSLYSSIISDIPEASHNWAKGYLQSGQSHGEEFLDKITTIAEQCESLDNFLLIHSIGGGLGSGLGSFLLNLLSDHFPEIFRINFSVLPENSYEVGPYNAVLAMKEMTEYADCVYQIDNQALLDIIKKNTEGNPEINASTNYITMNNIIASYLSDLTCSIRYQGLLGMSLKEISSNLVPFPNLQYVSAAKAPISSIINNIHDDKSLVQIFNEITDENSLIKLSSKNSVYLANALIFRGNATIYDIQANTNRLKNSHKMVGWNPENFKLALYNESPLHIPISALKLSNGNSINSYFSSLKQRFLKLHKKKSFISSYTQYMDSSLFSSSLSSLEELMERYTANTQQLEEPTFSRLKMIV
ncbi:unnamed protein product [Blepharisma stoltei]|uniref:Tubulin/FtsZ GTPase domain-containing protein n=1 Tax=Blepharisma stoltei TaxID=1481888 RepID=A0AAU9JK46_9CILI|nr:unnamed protein product [Blepharisma stoltei]